MNLPRYDYLPNEDFTDYEFYSKGPNGKIKKMITFTVAQEKPVLIYNIAFGDVDEQGNINDSVTSNNEDRDKVLATVAHAINDFCELHGNHLIFAQGSNAARTRLYQMSISRSWDEISIEFEIKGLTANGWEAFRKNANYNAFLPFWQTENKELYLYGTNVMVMAQNSKDTVTINIPEKGSSRVKHYDKAPYVVKKTEAAKETLRKFPVPENYSRQPGR